MKYGVKSRLASQRKDIVKAIAIFALILVAYWIVGNSDFETKQLESGALSYNLSK